MKAGTLEVAYVWWEGLDYWLLISLTGNEWPANTMITTAWTVRNVGDEVASFKVIFAGGGMDVESAPIQLNPDEYVPLYAYPTTPAASGDYECTLTIYADNEVVEEDVVPVTIVPPGAVNLYGFVHDSKGKPLPAVSVKVNEHTTATMLDGTFSLGSLPTGPVTVYCTKVGYQDTEKPKILHVGDNEIDIRMLLIGEEPPWYEKYWWALVLGGVGLVGGLVLLFKPKRKVK